MPKPPKFSKYFKEKALEEWARGLRPTYLARDLGIDRTTLYRWYYEALAKTRAADAAAQQITDEANRRLSQLLTRQELRPASPFLYRKVVLSTYNFPFSPALPACRRSAATKNST